MLVNVPLEQIDDNPFQRRQDYGDVEALAQDIQKRGLLQIPRGRLLFDGRPVDRGRLLATLDVTNGYPYGESFRVQLAFGHRRLRAYRHLESLGRHAFVTLPVYLEALTDDAMLDAVWSENQHRSDINAIEQAELLAEKLERARAAGGNQTTVAAEWDLDRSTIANKIRLLELPADVQTALRERRLSERQALALLPVLELEQKLDGAAVRWSEADYESWTPRSPSNFVARVLKDPQTATSDAIRDYVRSASHHAGKPLGDAFAAFEAGEGQKIIQPACKGCPKRQNQTCLAPACYEARYERYTAALGEWASRETGLPYSDEESNFSQDNNAIQALMADWDAGNHEQLVVGISNGYHVWRPFTDTRYVEVQKLLDDWKAGIIIGRSGAAAEPEEGDTSLRPPAAEIAVWKKAQTKADRERTARTKGALRSRFNYLAEDEAALQALVAMFGGYPLAQLRESLPPGQFPTVEQRIDLLFEQAWRASSHNSYEVDNREVLGELLHNAAISPDVVDPPDPVLRLTDIGQCALLRHEAKRDHNHSRYSPFAAQRLAIVRSALDEFEAGSSRVAADPDLQQLAAYLRAAEEREQKILAKFAAENATSGDPVETEQPASVEASS